MTNESVLRCTGLEKRFTIDRKGNSELTILRGIDFEVIGGEMIAIVGASGSGKSTLLHILGGLDRPSSGKVYWESVDIFAQSDETVARLRGKNIGFVFQFHHLLPEFTALENVIIPQMIQGTNTEAARTRARELLTKVGLAHRFEHRPGELSGGEQQRVAVARALANSPKLILADEPTGNLDSVSSQQLLELLGELNQRDGQTFVIVTHNEQFAKQAHRTLRMQDGKLESP